MFHFPCKIASCELLQCQENCCRTERGNQATQQKRICLSAMISTATCSRTTITNHLLQAKRIFDFCILLIKYIIFITSEFNVLGLFLWPRSVTYTPIWILFKLFKSFWREKLQDADLWSDRICSSWCWRSLVSFGFSNWYFPSQPGPEGGSESGNFGPIRSRLVEG